MLIEKDKISHTQEEKYCMFFSPSYMETRFKKNKQKRHYLGIEEQWEMGNK
jgi:hypothetical protein